MSERVCALAALGRLFVPSVMSRSRRPGVSVCLARVGVWAVQRPLSSLRGSFDDEVSLSFLQGVQAAHRRP